MLFPKQRPWNLPEQDAAPESAWTNRRQLLLAAGFGLAGWAGTEHDLAAQAVPASGAFRNGKRNPAFTRPDISPEAAATGFNNFYEFTTDKQQVRNSVGRFQTQPWQVEITGLVNRPMKLDLDEMGRRMQQEERVYRFRCVEAWSMVVPWTGFPLADLIRMVEPKPEARFVRWWTAYRPKEMPGMVQQPWYKWPYYEALRMDEAMNPLTLVATGIYGKPLPKQNGAPVRIVVPWKYGFKSIKSVVKIEFVKNQPSTFWNDAVPAEYGFYANVNPKRPHPRWSQATDKRIPTMDVEPTQPFNGYADYVAAMYKGNEI
ncbi:MAG: protein-methionine-sulfoxide reductase catalytic subunit MsrP [Bryobacterales bacterium]|jgi:sulfoxide reductase catalytic subunit YedY|nr:protein-methionine-sulfoxide reductase catalytic subunit MsrP [Bryobacterales bacterium]